MNYICNKNRKWKNEMYEIFTEVEDRTPFTYVHNMCFIYTIIHIHTDRGRERDIELRTHRIGIHMGAHTHTHTETFQIDGARRSKSKSIKKIVQ